MLIPQKKGASPPTYDANAGPFYGEGELYVSGMKVDSNYSLNSSKFEKVDGKGVELR